MIREATIEEVESCTPAAKWFFAECRLPGEFNEKCFVGIWKKIIEANLGKVFIRKRDEEIVEAIGVVFHPSMFTGESSAQVCFWYAQEVGKCRLAVAKIFTRMLRGLTRLGVKYVYVNPLVGFRFPQMRSLLEKFGFQPKEVIFTKELSWQKQ